MAGYLFKNRFLQRKAATTGLIGCILFLLAFELAGHQIVFLNKALPRREVSRATYTWKHHGDMVSFLKSKKETDEPFRVLDIDNAFSPILKNVYLIPQPLGGSALHVRSYFHFFTTLFKTGLFPAENQYGEPARRAMGRTRLARNLNVRYLIQRGREPAFLPGIFAFDRMLRTHRGEARYLFENRKAFRQRAFLVDRIIPVLDYEQAIEELARHPGRFSKAAYVAGGAERLNSPPGDLAYTLRFKSYTPSEVILTYESNKRAFLVMTDTYYPGWRAFLDESETPVYLTHGAFRGIDAPAGRHEVAFKFRPTRINLYAALSFTGAVLFLWAIRILRRNKKNVHVV